MAYFVERDLIREANMYGASSQFAARELIRKSVRSATGRYDFFLSHAKVDERLVFAVKRRLVDLGYSVYVDWIDDAHLARETVSSSTAATLRTRMDNSAGLLYLTTRASAASKWMPWEIGYFDGKRGADRIGIIPVVQTSGESFKGQEYLSLYPLFELVGGQIATVSPGGTIRQTVGSLRF